MELNSSNSKLKSPAQKLKSPVSDKTIVSNPQAQNDFFLLHVGRDPNSMGPEINLALKNQGNNIFASGSPLPGWLKTGRRKRTTPGKALSNQELSFSNHQVDDVLRFANEHPSEGHLPLKKRRPDLPTSSNAKNIMRSTLNENLPIMECGDSYPLEIRNNGEGTTNHRKRMRSTDIDVHKTHIKFPTQYVCNICDRSFKSYQALGGHKVHHKSKIKINSEEQKPKGICSFLHECTFCDKVFSTGQALGGHKRHCREPAPAKEERQEKRIVLRFDLNELPSE